RLERNAEMSVNLEIGVVDPFAAAAAAHLPTLRAGDRHMQRYGGGAGLLAHKQVVANLAIGHAARRQAVGEHQGVSAFWWNADVLLEHRSSELGLGIALAGR